MKVGVIAYPLDRRVGGGIDRYVHRLAEEFNGGSNQDDFVWIHGAPFDESSPFYGRSEVILPETGVRAAIERRRWSRNNPEELDVVWGPYFGVLPGPFGKVMTVHDLYEFTQWSHVRFRTATTLMVKQSDWIILDSNATREDLLSRFNVPEDRAITIPLGVDPPPLWAPKREDARAKLRQKFGWFSKAKIVLFVGTMNERKDPVSLVQAFARLHRTAHLTPQIRLVMLGARADAAEEVDDAVLRHGLGSVVVCPTDRSEEMLELCYAGSDVLCVPSISEGFGLHVLEAMMRGLPVVSTTGGSLPEVMGNAGVMVKPGDQFGIARGLLKVLDDEGLQNEMRKRGIERAKKFPWEDCARQTHDVLSQAGKGGGIQ